MRKISSWLATLFLMITMIGCAAKPKPSEPIIAFLSAIQTSMKTEFTDTEYFTSDVTVFDAFQKAENDASASNPISQKMLTMLSSFDYTILSETITKETALVVVEFTTYDLAAIFKEWMKQYIAKIPEIIKKVPPMTVAEITTMVNDLFLSTANAAKKDHIVKADIKLTLVDGKWKMDGGDVNKALFNALTGDFMSFYKDLPKVVAPGA
ncbi:MAG: hypothetical protein WBL80_03300 [Erysipelotrichaceae bacterium]